MRLGWRLSSLKTTLPCLVCLLLILLGGAVGPVLHGQTTLLYDDMLGDRPGDQAWLSYFDDGFLLGGVATQATSASGVRYTTDLQVRGGYSSHLALPIIHKNNAFPTLDPLTGFSLKFEAQLLSEAHTSADRAGFSVIVLDTNKRGIELGFWAGEIWPQRDDPLFTHGAGAAFDTTAGEVEYQLAVLGGGYKLLADGVALLAGPLQDYTAFGNVPYILSDYLFLGDDTARGQADVALGRIELIEGLTDGQVSLADIDNLCAATQDPTLGGSVTAAEGMAWFDLTGDGMLDMGDLDRLVLDHLGVEYGDADLDGTVRASSDGAQLLASLAGGTGLGWEDGDFDCSGTVLASTDGALLLASLPGDNGAAFHAIPEPSAVALFGCSLLFLGACAVGVRR